VDPEIITRFIEAAPDAIVVVDSDGRIVRVNSQAEQLFDYTRRQLLGKPVEMLVPAARHTEHARHRETFFAHPTVRPMGAGLDLFGRRRDGREFPVEISLSPFQTDDGQRFAVGAIRDISERRRAEALFRGLLESAPDAMVIVDETGTIVFVNAETERLFGYARGELLKQRTEMLVPARYRGEYERQRAAYVADPATRPMSAGIEMFGRRKDGTEFPFEVSLSPIPTEQGVLIASAIRDTSERRRAEQERLALIREQTARAEAEAANRMKDEFLVTLSHELRTPLNAVMGWASLLQTGQLDAATVTRGVEAIARNARVQAQLIEDLLDTSRIISGKLKLEPRVVDLGRVVEAAVDVVRPAVAAKDIAISVTLEPPTVPVAGDPDRLQQVVWNLLSNAVKFTPHGGRVEVRLTRRDTAAELMVADSGVGIDRAFLPYVFDRFRQEDSSTTRRHGGLGLGLAIVKHLVELHGGTVAVDSPGLHQGAAFTVRLPLQTAPLAAGPDAAPAAAGAPLDHVRVLVVDDQEDERMLLRTILERRGATVAVAAAADQALRDIRAWRPDVLVSDIAMPGHDGYWLVERVRELSRAEGGTVPALAVTAHARVEDRDRALGAGFQMYDAKPIDPARVVEAVATLARRG
jgi:PAS domain S-box-containing protein